MAVRREAVLTDIPAGCYRQPTETKGIDANGNRTNTIIIKGKYEALDDVRSNLTSSCLVVNGWTLSNATLSRQNGAGLLTIVCVPDPGEEPGEDGAPQQKSLKETWTLKAVRNDKSILAYCGGEGCPNRALVEAWQKEPDGVLAEKMSFTRSDGSICKLVDLGGDQDKSGISENTALSTRDLVSKLMLGIDSVMRFYPMLTKTSIYDRPPNAVYENLSTIDTPSFGLTAERIAPGNLSSIIDGHEWVKCQDDYAMTADGKHSRIESWLGSSDYVDVNLYGKDGDRWPMPYNHSKLGT